MMAGMIPANSFPRAVFEHTIGAGKKYQSFSPVLAWDDEGYPLVLASENPRRLERADGFSNFSHVDTDSDRAISAIPGGGWMIRWTDDEGGTSVEPVVAWLVDATGMLTPAIVDEDGFTSGGDPRTVVNPPKFFHPDQRTERPSTPDVA